MRPISYRVSSPGHFTLHETPDSSAVIDFVHVLLGNLARALLGVAENVSAGWNDLFSKRADRDRGETPFQS
jgi:hypothetical protein